MLPPDDNDRPIKASTAPTDLQQQVEALENDFDCLSESLAAAAVFLDADGRVRRFTSRAGALFGLDDTVLGRPLAEIEGALPAEGLAADIAAAAADRAPREKELQAANDCWYLRRVTLSGGAGPFGGVLITFIDVTRQQQLNATLESRVRERVRTLELLQRVAAIVNSARSVNKAFQEVIDAVCEYLGWPVGHAYAVPPVHDNRFGSLDIWSHGAQRDFHDLVAAWRGKPLRPGEGLIGVVAVPETPAWLDLDGLPGLARRDVDVHDFDPSLALIMPVRVGSRTVAAVEFFCPPGGRRQPVLPLIDQVGSELGYIVERQQLEFRTLRQQRGLAQVTRLAVIGEMAGSIAHQLNQPLTAIMNYIAAGKRLLQTTESAPEGLSKVCDRVDEQARRAADYIGHMRNYARRQQPRPKLLNIHQPLESAIALVMPAARTASVAIETDFDRDLPAIYIDPTQMEQVFIGLLMNAIESMEETEGSDRLISIHTRRMDAWRIQITIADRGHGIPHDVMDYVFEPFFSTREGSVGMGLAIGRSIVEGFGGRIQAERVTPNGVRFHVVLPVEREGEDEVREGGDYSGAAADDSVGP
ncbi:MAG TPA: ATP-binding protein [Gammaproteobacteria bacterium]|nr:ATP-binding protein [Gammaproteobacteria bacterium]